MDWFCQGLINLLMETLSAFPIYFVGRYVVEEADTPSPHAAVYLSSTILGGDILH